MNQLSSSLINYVFIIEEQQIPWEQRYEVVEDHITIATEAPHTDIMVINHFPKDRLAVGGREEMPPGGAIYYTGGHFSSIHHPTLVSIQSRLIGLNECSN
jgi:hypothetical protein